MFRGLYQDYGIAQLIQWYIEDCENPPEVGRPPRVPRVTTWFQPWSEPVRANRPGRKVQPPELLSLKKILSDILKRLNG
jgi:hypothetical protein